MSRRANGWVTTEPGSISLSLSLWVPTSLAPSLPWMHVPSTPVHDETKIFWRQWSSRILPSQSLVACTELFTTSSGEQNAFPGPYPTTISLNSSMIRFNIQNGMTWSLMWRCDIVCAPRTLVLPPSVIFAIFKPLSLLPRSARLYRRETLSSFDKTTEYRLLACASFCGNPVLVLRDSPFINILFVVFWSSAPPLFTVISGWLIMQNYSFLIART